MIRPLERREQYEAYLKHKYESDVQEQSQHQSATSSSILPASESFNAKIDAAFIHSLHLHTGGRLRDINRWYSQLEISTLPVPDSAEYMILQKLSYNQVHVEFNAFDPIAVDASQIDSWLETYNHERIKHRKTADFVDFHTLLDSNIIIEHPIQRGKFTFATPGAYFRMKPK